MLRMNGDNSWIKVKQDVTISNPLTNQSITDRLVKPFKATAFSNSSLIQAKASESSTGAGELPAKYTDLELPTRSSQEEMVQLVTLNNDILPDEAIDSNPGGTEVEIEIDQSKDVKSPRGSRAIGGTHLEEGLENQNSPTESDAERRQNDILETTETSVTALGNYVRVVEDVCSPEIEGVGQIPVPPSEISTFQVQLLSVPPAPTAVIFGENKTDKSDAPLSNDAHKEMSEAPVPADQTSFCSADLAQKGDESEKEALTPQDNAPESGEGDSPVQNELESESECGSVNSAYVVQHPEITWEKPTWTKKPPVKQSKTGESIKQGSDLASPISYPLKYRSDGRHVEASSATLTSPPSSPEKQLGWQKPSWVKTKLRTTGKGDSIKSGSDLQSPITHVKKQATNDINFEANPLMLKATERGSAVRLGDNLANPITHVERSPMADINFEASPDLVLQETVMGKVVKKGSCLANPITFPKKKEVTDVNFDAHPAMLKPTEKGAAMKKKGDLQGPITHVQKNNLGDINFEANPLILRPTRKGSAARLGENLALPITHIAKLVQGDAENAKNELSRDKEQHSKGPPNPELRQAASNAQLETPLPTFDSACQAEEITSSAASSQGGNPVDDVAVPLQREELNDKICGGDVTGEGICNQFDLKAVDLTADAVGVETPSSECPLVEQL